MPYVIIRFFSLSNYKFQSAETLFKELLQDPTANLRIHLYFPEYIG